MFHFKVYNPRTENLKSFLVRVERKTRKKLKYSHVDNGSEYLGLFEQYYSDHDISLTKIFRTYLNAIVIMI